MAHRRGNTALDRAPIADDYRLQYRAPAVSAADVPWPQGAPLDIAKLVEYEQQMVASATSNQAASIGATLLLAVGRLSLESI